MYVPPEDRGLYEARQEHDSCGVGAVVNVSGRRDHAVIERGKEVLLNLRHRGAASADETTGDGAGILIQLPHAFFAEEAERLGFGLSGAGSYGVGMVFGPLADRELRGECDAALSEAVEHYGMKVAGWREVPADNSTLGELAKLAEPSIKQVFIDGCGLAEEALERRLYMARKRAERLVRERLGTRAADFYVASMSSRTIVYKGMFFAQQLFAYYPDLADERTVTALALVHQRYSTNTFPNWRLAQPFRIAAHNGEINTLSANINRMRARERRMVCGALGEDLSDLFPVLTPGTSDSAQFDNCLELLVRAGRALPHALMMMIPEAFGARYHMSTDKRAFYEYHAAIMEPWDGPAAMVVTDGRLVGGTLDRNGLRPSRYVVTTDGLVILGSETGVVEFPPEQIQQKGRLQPGRMFLVDTEAGRIITDNEIKSKVSRQKPYRRWLEENRIELRGLFDAAHEEATDPEQLARRQRQFGYTREELQEVLKPMAVDAQEPLGSMGTDTPLAVLSERPRLLFDYFKQLFAQVTNPPIDPLREGLVMSLMTFAGKRRNLLAETAEHCRQLKLSQPIMTNDDVARLRATKREDLKAATVAALFEANTQDPGEALERGVERMIREAEEAIAQGASLIILSDRHDDAERAAIPCLLATSALHHALLDHNLRGEAGIVVESGEPREVMHFCLLMGFGANAVNPYVALETLAEMRRGGDLPKHLEPTRVVDNYVTAIKKGILKVMSKMGISTLRSYRSAQMFECIGINREVVERYFARTTSRIGGVGLSEIAAETLRRHEAGLRERGAGEPQLDFGGEYHYRKDGEKHLWNPQTVTLLQQAVRNNRYETYREFAKLINDQSERLCTLRGLFELAGDGKGVALEEVEPAEEIVKRFCTGAMSHGSISAEAHETLARAMNRLGAMSNTGEGGEDPRRYETPAGAESSNCGIKQVASARFGVTVEYIANARVLQIKMAQGAKPGEGGHLPGHKVTEEIARLRHATPGVSLISPPPHHDIYSIEDLAQLIYDLKCANPGVAVSVKLVSEIGVGTVAAGVVKGNADEVLISGYDGGTGASPLSSIKHAGCPWELGLAETQQTLVSNGLRDRVLVQVDGQMRTGRDVVVGALLGAERFGFGTAALVTLGCLLVRKCHHGTCPVGIATQLPELRKRFAGKPEHLVNYMTFVAQEVRELMAELGYRKFDDMVGHVERLGVRKAVEHWKSRGLDLSGILMKPRGHNGQTAMRRVRPQPDRIGDHLDWQILEKVRPALERGERVQLEMGIRNVNRTVGTILSHHIVKKHGAKGLADGTIEITFHGSAGQSFGAFLAPGVTLKLVGDANDYVGKGLSGGRIIVMMPPGSPFQAHDNVIAGNTILYGATSGEAFINGLAGERFAVRNSGALAVVEGVGDHACEYMTAGRVIVLGQTGHNFGAGMSGGIAYVLDENQLFDTLCNLDMVDLETVYQEEDIEFLRRWIERHRELTGSARARRILENWTDMMGRFVKVMPLDYRNALRKMREREQAQDEVTPATEEVFGV